MKPVNGEEWKGSRIRNSQGEPPPKKDTVKKGEKDERWDTVLFSGNFRILGS